MAWTLLTRQAQGHLKLLVLLLVRCGFSLGEEAESKGRSVWGSKWPLNVCGKDGLGKGPERQHCPGKVHDPEKAGALCQAASAKLFKQGQGPTW